MEIYVTVNGPLFQNADSMAVKVLREMFMRGVQKYKNMDSDLAM